MKIERTDDETICGDSKTGINTPESNESALRELELSTCFNKAMWVCAVILSQIYYVAYKILKALSNSEELLNEYFSDQKEPRGFVIS